MAAGLDPAVGFLHKTYRDKQGLVFDLMEPLWPIVDRRVLEFVQGETSEPADFVLLDDGVCRLNPQLAQGTAQRYTYYYNKIAQQPRGWTILRPIQEVGIQEVMSRPGQASEHDADHGETAGSTNPYSASVRSLG